MGKKFIAPIGSIFKSVGLAVLLTMISCNPSPQEEERMDDKRVFNPTIANSEFEGKPTAEKWDYLLTALNSKHTSTAEFEDWFLEKFYALRKEDFIPNESVVKAINTKFSWFKYLKAGKVFAEYTLNSKDSTSFRSSQNLAYNIMAQYFVFDRQVDSTAKYLAKLEKGLGEDASNALIISYFNTKGELETIKGDMFGAIINFNKALGYVPDNEVINRFMLELSIAGVYVEFKFIEKAKYHVDKAYALLPFDSIPEKYLNTLGIVEYQAGNYEKSDRIFSRSIQFGTKQGRPEIIAPTYANYANLRRTEKRYNEALEFTYKSDSICGLYDYMKVGFLINRLNRAEIYYDQTRYEEALNELQGAYPDLIAYDILNFKIAYYESLYKIFDKLGMKASADSNYRMYKEYEAEYNGDLGLSAVTEWELATERERAMEETNKVNESKQKEVLRLFLIALILSISLLLVSIAFFAIYRKRTKERERFLSEAKRLNQNLEDKSKALLTESMNNLTIQNVKDDILRELEEILNRLPDKVKREFSNLTFRLTSGKESNYLDEFESRFKGVYESFYKKLLEQAPDLTPNELRVCAFIRLNITSKDIARLTGKSLGTLDNTRTFIRKKLKLDSDVNLQRYLLDL